MSAQDPFFTTFRRARDASAAVKDAHKPAVREQRNGFFRPYCSCGWESVHPQARKAEALKGAIHHLAQEQRRVLDQVDNGVSLHEIVSGIEQDHPTR